MMISSTHADKVAKDAIEQLNAHTSKEWTVHECSFSRVTLRHGKVFVDHLITTNSWIAELHDCYTDDLRSQYVDSPIKAYNGLKATVKDFLDDVQEVYNRL